MNSAHIAAVALLIGSSALSAQNAGSLQAPLTVLLAPAAKNACPVAMRAKQESSGNALRVNGARPKGIGQLVHLLLSNPNARQIARAQGTVSGLSGKARVTQAFSDQPGISDATQNFDVALVKETDKEAGADLWVPGMTSIQSIELKSVTYADGFTWRIAAGEACRVAPDGVMLIVAR